MTTEPTGPDQGDRLEKENQPHRIRLPGFVSDQEIGLGDVIKRATSAIGIQPCGGCEQRAAWLNRRIAISPWRQR
jgi:hypothetical protein